MRDTVLVGIDPSPRASGIVAFICDPKTYAIREVHTLTFVKKKGDSGDFVGEDEVGNPLPTMHSFVYTPDALIANGRMDRLNFVSSRFRRFCATMVERADREIFPKDGSVIGAGEGGKLVFACEDYTNRATGMAYTIGEMQGIFRLIAYTMGSLRLYDIQGIKIFATGKGDAEKPEMLLSYIREEKGDADMGLPTERVNEDICDAWWIAEMLRTEMKVRAGIVEIRDLPERRRDMFLRVTKAMKTNILSTPFQTRVGFEDRAPKEKAAKAPKAKKGAS